MGAVIGYFTNWLAVRMLFRPYYAKKIGKWRLPFTPGIIPKRKSALAKAVGTAVGEQLFTQNDVSAALTSAAAKEKIADRAVTLWGQAGELTAQELVGRVACAERAEQWRQTAESALSDKLYAAVRNFDFGGVVAREGVKAVNQKKAALGMLAMFLSDDLVSSLADKLGDGVNRYVEENGREFIASAVRKELDQAVAQPLSVLTDRVEEQTVREVAGKLYECAVNAAVGELAECVDISAIVEAKINDMDVKELEKLVLSVMKKELNAIVNLGALIGLILGVVMIFI